MRRVPKPLMLSMPLTLALGCGERPIDYDADSTENLCSEDRNPEPLEIDGCTITAGFRPNCLVRRHAVIECDSLGVGAGLRVAADDEGAWLTVVSRSQAWMFGAGSQG